MAAVIVHSDFEPRERKSATVSIISPSICHKVMGPDAVVFVFWMLSFNPAFSLSSFTCIKRLFSSSSLTAIRVISSAYLRLFIFLPAILIPVCDSASLAFWIMYSAQKLNKQGDSIQLDTILFQFWTSPLSTSNSNSCFLTLKQVSQKTCMMVLYAHLFKNFPVCCDPHTQRL